MSSQQAPGTPESGLPALVLIALAVGYLAGGTAAGETALQAAADALLWLASHRV